MDASTYPCNIISAVDGAVFQFLSFSSFRRGSVRLHGVRVPADYAGYADVSAMFMQLGERNILKVVGLWLTLIRAY